METSIFIEKYEKAYKKDPRSKVFAALAEAYRKQGDLDEALRIGEDGVLKHPHFPSGRVALAKIFFDKQMYERAIPHLKVVTEISPENIMAHSLLASCYKNLKKSRDALEAYKRVLFLNPNDALAIKAVQKLESLFAGDYEKEVFERKAETVDSPPIPSALSLQKTLDRNRGTSGN
jgi:tetratricopeptide (TPR) repeat protein